jgi:hypothetical protein
MQEFKNSKGATVQLDNEQETRDKFMTMARTLGCLPEYQQIISKYDALVRGCTNEQERKAIATMGILEVHNLFNGYTSVGFGGKLVIDGKVIIEQKLTKDEEND